MVKELIELINIDRPDSITPLDKDRCTIRCLPHVLHLAITDLLKALKSLAKDATLDIVTDALTEEEAERLHAERSTAAADDDSDVPEELSDTDRAYAILKVRYRFFFYFDCANFNVRFDLSQS